MIGKERDNYPLIALSSSYLSRSLEFLIYYSLLADSTVVFPHTKKWQQYIFWNNNKKDFEYVICTNAQNNAYNLLGSWTFQRKLINALED